jgi:hypothetical protein
VSVSCPVHDPFAEHFCVAPPPAPPPPPIETQQSCVVRSHEDDPHVSDVLVLPVVVPDPVPEPPVVEPEPEDPDPDPLDEPDPEDPLLPELDDPPLLPVDPLPGLLPFDPVPDPLSSTVAIFPPHAIAKKITANENAFEDFKTNLFLERNRFRFSIEPNAERFSKEGGNRQSSRKTADFVARRTRFVNEWKVLSSALQRVRT